VAPTWIARLAKPTDGHENLDVGRMIWRRSAELYEGVGAHYSGALMRSATRALDPAAELDRDLVEIMREAPGGRRSYGELL
jgi:hypothetical protein